MTGTITSTLRWLRRHALPAVAATLIVGAAAGGGITYAMTSSPSPAAAATTTKPAPKGGAATRGKGALFAHQVVAIMVRDTGMTLAAIKAELAKGQTLDQIAGTNATKLENDIVTALTTALSKRVPAARAPERSTALATAIRKRVHAVMAEPGTQLLQQLELRKVGPGQPMPSGLARPKNARRRPVPSPSPSPAA